MRIDRMVPLFKRNWKTVSMAALAPLLTDQTIINALRLLDHTWRKSIFHPVEVVRSMLHRALSPDAAIGNTVEHLSAGGIDITKSAWCQAVLRLPLALLDALIGQTARDAIHHFSRTQRWHGRPVYMVDGTTVSMPDTPDLNRAFGLHNTKHGYSKFPLARVVVLLEAGVRAIVDYRFAPIRTSELTLWRDMIRSVPRGAVLVADRMFSTIPDFVLLSRRNIDLISKLHGRRNAQRLLHAGRKLGKDEWLVTFTTTAVTRRNNPDVDFPCSIKVRLIRHRFKHNKQWKTTWLVTSILDHRAFPRLDIVNEYRARWGIETHIYYLKNTLDMRVLRGRTEASVRRELAAILLAHNLVWMLINTAGRVHRVPAARISFIAAVRIILHASPHLNAATRKDREALAKRVLLRIAGATNPHRPGRIEPRLVKRGPLRYQSLKTTRDEARKHA